MDNLDPDQLGAVTGGKSTTTHADGSTTHQQSNYESCVDAMERSASQKYPDDRNFLHHMFGQGDWNAGPRADWLKDAIPEACGKPPPG